MAGEISPIILIFPSTGRFRVIAFLEKSRNHCKQVVGVKLFSCFVGHRIPVMLTWLRQMTFCFQSTCSFAPPATTASGFPEIEIPEEAGTSLTVHFITRIEQRESKIVCP